MSEPTSRCDTPFRINLEQQKKQAKELLKAFHSAEKAALSRFKQHHPKYADYRYLPSTSNEGAAQLSDAQLVIARELGLPSWPKLKAHITSMTQASDAIKAKASSPDSDFKTLHIRCGTDLGFTLPAGGFEGDFLEYSDPYGQGPILLNDNFINTRAKFLHESYDPLFENIPDDSRKSKTLQGTLTYLISAHDKLKQAAQQYKRVVLWFEHDGYDQLILAKLLSFYARTNMPEKLELISINHFPGSARFIGLGQLPPEAIRLLWKQRQPVNQKQLKLGERVWSALGESSPLPLYNVIKSKDIKHLPNMGAALRRHLQELPSTSNGLSLTEQLSLEMLNEESITAGLLFKKLVTARDPLPWLGDIMYWFILQSMMQVSQPVFEISECDLKKPWHERLLTITDTGKKVLTGTQGWLSLNPPDRWLGGIKLRTNHPCWHWNDKEMRPVLI
jgi:hypothetical protein